MNLKFHTKWLLIIAMLISFQSIVVATSLTSVGAHQVIGLSYKNDCILSLGGMNVGDHERLTAQTGYVYNNNIAFQIGYQYFSDYPYPTSRIGSGITYTEYYKDHFAHASIGVFYPIKIKNSKWGNTWKNKGKWYSPRNVLLDVYMGFAKGINNRSLELTSSRLGVVLINNLRSNSTINFNKWYAQGGLHYNGHIFGTGISGTFGILNFRKISIRGIPEDDMINLVNLFEKDATYYTYGFQFKTWLCFDAFTVLYHNHQNFIAKQEFLNRHLYNYYGEVSIQVKINQLFRKKKADFED